MTSFIGRTRELAEVKQRLLTTRLLTLTGPGGCGKTRLALQAAGELADTCADGVWCVELAPLFDPTLVPHLVASALGVREEPHRPLPGTLAEALHSRQLLLVLDNCEHLRLTSLVDKSLVTVDAQGGKRATGCSRRFGSMAGRNWGDPGRGGRPLAASGVVYGAGRAGGAGVDGCGPGHLAGAA